MGERVGHATFLAILTYWPGLNHVKTIAFEAESNPSRTLTLMMRKVVKIETDMFFIVGCDVLTSNILGNDISQTRVSSINRWFS